MAFIPTPKSGLAAWDCREYGLISIYKSIAYLSDTPNPIITTLEQNLPGLSMHLQRIPKPEWVRFLRPLLRSSTR